MAGYQTYGSAIHANATALYASPKPATCTTCSQIGAVVSEPSVLRQATGVLEASTLGAGAVMTGVGIMNNDNRDNYYDYQNYSNYGEHQGYGNHNEHQERYNYGRGYDRDRPRNPREGYEHGEHERHFDHERSGFGQERSYRNYGRFDD